MHPREVRNHVSWTQPTDVSARACESENTRFQHCHELRYYGLEYAEEPWVIGIVFRGYPRRGRPWTIVVRVIYSMQRLDRPESAHHFAPHPLSYCVAESANTSGQSEGERRRVCDGSERRVGGTVQRPVRKVVAERGPCLCCMQCIACVWEYRAYTVQSPPTVS